MGVKHFAPHHVFQDTGGFGVLQARLIFFLFFFSQKRPRAFPISSPVVEKQLRRWVRGLRSQARLSQLYSEQRFGCFLIALTRLHTR